MGIYLWRDVKLNKKYIYLMALIGSTLGILGSVIWVYYGTSIVGGWIEDDIQAASPLSDKAMKAGLLIAFIQSIITISFFIVALVKSTPENLEIELKNTGMWLLVIGIGNVVINFFQWIPCILLIAAGAFSIREAKKLETDNADNETESSDGDTEYTETGKAGLFRKYVKLMIKRNIKGGIQWLKKLN